MKPGEDQKPIYEKQYRLPIIKKTAINELIEDHHAAGIIEPSTSPWTHLDFKGLKGLLRATWDLMTEIYSVGLPDCHLNSR